MNRYVKTRHTLKERTEHRLKTIALETYHKVGIADVVFDDSASNDDHSCMSCFHRHAIKST